MEQGLNQFEFGWLVGLLEGEGCFNFNGSTQCIDIKMVDEDTITRYIDVIEKLIDYRINIKHVDRGGNRQQIYRALLCGDNARSVMRIVVPHMCQRRKQKIWQSLNKYTAKKLKLSEVLPEFNTVKSNMLIERRL